MRAAVADDLDTASALAIVWAAIRQANQASDAPERRGLLDLVLDADRVLGLGLEDAIHDGQRLPNEVAALIHKRQDAREARDWAAADALREAIRRHGYEVEDTFAGTRWRPSA